MTMPLHIQEFRLRNGLRVWLVEHHALPLTVFHLVIPAGADADPPGLAGLASLTADTLETGTRSMDMYAIADRLEYSGASIQSQATYDGSTLFASMLKKHLDPVLEVLAELLEAPVFPVREVERMKGQRLASLLQQKDRPASIASRLLTNLLFGNHHPYANEVIGTEAGLRGITRDDAQRFHAAFYKPDRSTLIVAGDFTKEEAERLCGRYLESWNAGTAGLRPELPPGRSQPPGFYIVDRPGATQSEIRMGRIALQRDNSTLPAAMVLNRALGGQFSSRLNQNLRERRGLTYGAWSAFMPLRRPGPLLAGGAFHTEGTGEAVGELLGEIRRMREYGITEEELTFARESMAGAFALAFETPAQIAGTLHNIPLYDLPRDYYDTYVERIRSVSADDCRLIAEKWLEVEAMTVVIVCDAASVRPQLEQTGIGRITFCDADGGFIQPSSAQ
jgi:zinc protease